MTVDIGGDTKVFAPGPATLSGILGPVRVEERFVYAKPMVLESPVPIGAVVFATREEVTEQQERLLGGFLRHLDTRLDAAEHLLRLRWRNLDLEFEIKKLKGEIKAPEPVGRVRREAIPENIEQSMAELAKAVPKLQLFGVSLPSEHYAEFCRAFDSVTDRYLKILEKAENLYLDVPSGVRRGCCTRSPRTSSRHSPLVAILRPLPI